MTSAVQSVEIAEVSRDVEVGTGQARALLRFGAEHVQNLSTQHVMELQALLQHGSTLGVWETPKHWLPPGTQALHRRSSNLRERLLSYLPAQSDTSSERFELALQHATLALSRYLVLVRIGPAGLGKRGANHSLDVTTISGLAHSHGPALFAKALAKLLEVDELALSGDDQPEPMLLARLSRSDLEPLSKNLRKDALNECVRMRMLAERGLWHDVPPLAKPSKPEAMKGAPLLNEPPAKRDPHLPFPDDYLSEMAWKSKWLMRNLAPNVLAIAEQIVVLWKESLQQGWVMSSVISYRQEKISEMLTRHRWLDEQGVPFMSIPFELNLPGATGFEASSIADIEGNNTALLWPPKNFRDVKGLLGAVQMAHYFVIALSMGARSSEALSLKRDCVQRDKDGRQYANGRTYKLVQSFEGELRDWLLPDLAVEAIEQQARLAAVAEKLHNAGQSKKRTQSSGAPGVHLWGEISAAPASDSSQPLRNINNYLRRYATTLGMSTEPGGQNIRSHRFRKTLARLVGLALTQAPKILMDVFGHKSIEMTLYYILADKDLRAEIETVARELRVMRAKEVVEHLVDAQLAARQKPTMGGYGGLGAVTLNEAVRSYRDRVHRRGEDWSVSRVNELAELLTMQGTAWEQVRPGVLCTKLPGEAGPCNKSRGRPEPSKCQTTCGNRLEESFHREDVDGSIQESVTHYLNAVAEGEELMSAHWAGQIRAHVMRFDDLKEKWMLNSTVQSLMNVQDTEVD